MAEGTIKRLTDRGFGFIDTAKGKDLFFHSSSVEGASFDDLHEGQKVSYTEGQGKKGAVCRERQADIVRPGLAVWLRHQITAYDSMKIPRIKGKRRETRWMPAQRSLELLGWYRKGEAARDDWLCQCCVRAEQPSKTLAEPSGAQSQNQVLTKE